MTLPVPYHLTTKRPEDEAAIEALLDRCFGADRHKKISYRYRQGVAPVKYLSLVARDRSAAVLGSIRYWPVRLEGRPETKALLLGPLAVEPALKGQGIGKTLVRQTLAMAEWARTELVLLVGDAAYYGAFGFEPAAPHGFVMPGEAPERLQALALRPGALAGGGVLRPWRAARRAA